MFGIGRHRLARCSWAFALVVTAVAAHAQKPKVRILSVEDGLPSSTIVDLEQDPSGRLWILSRAGVSVYDGRTLVTYTSADGLPSYKLRDLDVDAGGRVWTVVEERPWVYYLEGGTWRALPQPVSSDRWSRTSSLSVVSTAQRRHVVVGTTAHGLVTWDGEAWSRISAADGLASDQVTDLARVGEEIAVATRAGLCRLRLPSSIDCALRHRERLLAQPIVDLYPRRGDGEPHRLWLLGVSWLAYLEDDRVTKVADGFELSSRAGEAGTLAVDRLGGIYYGSPGRAWFLDPAAGVARPFGRREGLVTDGATAFLVDREANVWIGSLRGISQVESRRFVSFDRDQGLLESEVTALLEPSPGRLVLGHNQGLTMIDGERVETLAFPPAATGKVHPSRVLDMAVDSAGEIWLAAQSLGLLRLVREGTWSVEAAMPEPEVGQAFSVELDAQGRLWMLARNRLLVRNGVRFTRVDTGFDTKDLGLLRWLTAAADGRLFVASRGGLLWYDGRDWHRVRGPTAAADNLYDVFVEASGSVRVATGDGLFELRGSELVRVREGQLEIRRPIYFIFGDTHGRQWYGTDDGVFVWDRKRLRHLSVAHGLAGRETNRGAALVDHRGRVWIGTDQGVSMYREDYDRLPLRPPTVEIRAVEAAGQLHPPDVDLRLRHYQNTLTLRVDTITMSREERVLVRYRLDEFDPGWQGPEALSGSEIRYTNLPPGRYRFRISAGWPQGPWSAEAVSVRITITPPLWHRSWFLALSVAGAVALVFGVHRLRTRVVRARYAALEALNARLEESIAERDVAQAERERLIAELESRNAELERFTYTVSHDLKSPLFTVQGFLGLLAQDASKGDSERMDRDIREIRKAVFQMGQLLNELLELSRVGRVVNPSQRVSLTELAREAVSAEIARRPELESSIEIASDLPTVVADRLRLLEVFENLVGNAIKYMGDQPSPRIEILARHDDGECVVVVRDNGIGIEPRYHELVFGLFERLDPRMEGTGVGLALAKRIVEFHGGRIWVESQGLGHGAAFCFTLPRESAPG